MNRAVKLSTDRHMVSRLRMSGAVPFPFHVLSWLTQGQPFLYFFTFVFRTDALNCWCYMASVLDATVIVEHWWNYIDRGYRNSGRIPCSIAILSSTNSVWADCVLNPVLCVNGLRLTAWFVSWPSLLRWRNVVDFSMLVSFLIISVKYVEVCVCVCVCIGVCGCICVCGCVCGLIDRTSLQGVTFNRARQIWIYGHSPFGIGIFGPGAGAVPDIMAPYSRSLSSTTKLVSHFPS